MPISHSTRFNQLLVKRKAREGNIPCEGRRQYLGGVRRILQRIDSIVQ